MSSVNMPEDVWDNVSDNISEHSSDFDEDPDVSKALRQLRYRRALRSQLPVALRALFRARVCVRAHRQGRAKIRGVWCV